MPTDDELNAARDEEVIAMVARLYDLFLGENPDTPKITTHDLADWGYMNWKIDTQDRWAILGMPNIFLP
jgi:hypothetical protein